MTNRIRYATPSRDAIRIAAASGVDPRTAQRVLNEGAHVVRTRLVRESIEVAAASLGIALPGPAGGQQ